MPIILLVSVSLPISDSLPIFPDFLILSCVQELRRLTPFFVPRILINMAAGHVSIRHGFKVG